jgi:hypothetical protein
MQARGITLAALEGIWSDPRVLLIEDFPPPAGIVPMLVSANPVVDKGVESFQIELVVNYNTPIPSSPPESVERGLPILESGMSVTMYTVAVGFEPIVSAFRNVPMSSIQSNVVSCEGGGKKGVWDGIEKILRQLVEL